MDATTVAEDERVLTSDLEYHLPDHLVATTPAARRDRARLLVVERSGTLDHRHVEDLPDLVTSGDTFVFNSTRVLRARFLGSREDTGGSVEGLYLHPGPDVDTWVCMLRMRRFRAGATIRLLDRDDGPTDVVLTLVESTPEGWVVRVEGDAMSILDRVGRVPLPPYIRSRRKVVGLDVPDDEDHDRYQTVFARASGSVAAPTAGLHFTPDLLGRLDRAGVRRLECTLHVGTGTFRPIETERVEDHPMHTEWCAMDEATSDAMRNAIGDGPALTCVGTTSARTVETYAALDSWRPHVDTDLLITPGYAWRATRGLLTNFHLPRSTLLAMVGALLPGGLAQLLEIYAEAISHEYRFYSYGDAMLIRP
ncbi:MAG: tRNA preQ1(34) S-adenosylmethionine ribosyltransferase-isomerase QueA [Phycisphaerales bacterium]|nr:tRNA preQ1(34) S-adenosylmethionine ribosyltransferase-isomerase QueA [Phycisphaerales bacterium]